MNYYFNLNFNILIIIMKNINSTKTIEESIIDLYLNVKVRKHDDVNNFNNLISVRKVRSKFLRKRKRKTS